MQPTLKVIKQCYAYWLVLVLHYFFWSSNVLKAWWIIMFLSSRVIVLFPEIHRGEGEGVCVCLCDHMTHYRATPPDAITHSIRLRSAFVFRHICAWVAATFRAYSFLSHVFYTSEEHPVTLEDWMMLAAVRDARLDLTNGLSGSWKGNYLPLIVWIVSFTCRYLA